MSLRVMTQGGGTGGESASIFVTGLGEDDTVTATKGGKTVRGKWVSKETTVLAPLIPVMTSNTTPSGTASSTSTITDQLYRAYRAFDGDINTTGDAWYGYNPTLSDRTIYTFDTMQTDIRKVYIRGYGNNSGIVNSGVIEYTENGNDWKTLATFTANANSVELEIDVSVDRLIAIRVGATSTSNNQGMLFREIQIYGFVNVLVEGHEITPIKSYGMWTVTATNGEKTTTQDVLVDAAVEYEIFMNYKLWLYRKGDECEDVTGGWNTCPLRYNGKSPFQTDNSTFAKLGDSLKFTLNKVNRLASTGIAAGCSNLIDVTEYTKLCMKYDYFSLSSDSTGVINGVLITGTVLGDYYYDTANVGLSPTKGTIYQNEVVTRDISAVSGNQYVWIRHDNASGDTVTVKSEMRISEIWLE